MLEAPLDDKKELRDLALWKQKRFQGRIPDRGQEKVTGL